MATLHLHRLLFVIPLTLQGGFSTWWTNNIDGVGGAQTFSVGLSVTGLVPATHFWMCGSFTPAELKKIMVRLCVLSGVTQPVAWDTWTRAQKKSWFVSNIPTIKTVTGIAAIVLDDNDGAWSDYLAMATSAGLKPIVAVKV